MNKDTGILDQDDTPEVTAKLRNHKLSPAVRMAIRRLTFQFFDAHRDVRLNAVINWEEICTTIQTLCPPEWQTNIALSVQDDATDWINQNYDDSWDPYLDERDPA